MKKFLILFNALWCVGVSILFAQNVRTLKIGDKCPDFLFDHVLNAKRQFRLSDLKGKLVIFDMASAECAPCIESAKKLNEYQANEFKGKIAPVFITSDSKVRVSSFLTTNKFGKTLHIPYVYDDKVLAKYFPHKFIPHTVWISPGGKILAITDHTYINAANIRKILSGEQIDWPIKYDDFDINLPLVTLNEHNFPFAKQLPKVISYGTITTHADGVSDLLTMQWDSISLKKGSKAFRITMINAPIELIYRRLFGKFIGQTPSNRIVYEVKDLSRYGMYSVHQDNQANAVDWIKQNTYCYDSTFPLTLSKEAIRQQAVEQLNNAFGLNVRLEMRETECWILTGSLNGKFLIPESEVPRDGYIHPTEGEKIGMLKAGNLAFGADWVPDNPPVFDETRSNLTDKAKFLPVDVAWLGNFELANKELAKYGLIFKKEKRKVEMLIISEISGKNN